MVYLLIAWWFSMAMLNHQMVPAVSRSIYPFKTNIALFRSWFDGQTQGHPCPGIKKNSASTRPFFLYWVESSWSHWFHIMTEPCHPNLQDLEMASGESDGASPTKAFGISGASTRALDLGLVRKSSGNHIIFLGKSTFLGYTWNLLQVIFGFSRWHLGRWVRRDLSLTVPVRAVQPPSELPFWSQVNYWFQKQYISVELQGPVGKMSILVWTSGLGNLNGRCRFYSMFFFANPRNPLPVAARDSTGLLRIHWRGDSWRAMRANGCAGAPSEGSAEVRKPWLNALTGSWGCLKIGYPQNHRFQYENGLIWMIWGYHHVRKFPFRVCFS